MHDSDPQARFDRQIAHLRRVFEQEREMLAYDIHDGALQDLVGAKWAIEANLTKLQSGQPVEAGLLESAQELLGQAIAELRQTVLEHRPFDLGKRKLGEAIWDFVKRLPQCGAASSHDGPQVHIDFELEGDASQLRGDLQLNLYRIVQQAVHNSLCHAAASRICVKINQTSTEVSLCFTDNGIGFDPADAPRAGLGLASIRERTRMFDGTCRMESQAGLGTTIEVTIPLATRPDR